MGAPLMAGGVWAFRSPRTGVWGNAPGSPRAWTRRHRRGLAAISATAAVLALGVTVRPADPLTQALVVAATDLPAGHRLTADDLTLAEVPTGIIVPSSTATPDPLVGQVLARPTVAGEAVGIGAVMSDLAGRLTAPSATQTGGAQVSSVPLPVRFADAAAVALLAAGQRIDVLAARSASVDSDMGPNASPVPERARIVASEALVLSVSGVAPDADGSLLGDGFAASPTGGSTSGLVLLAVTPDQALAVAGAEASSRLTFAMRP